MTGRRSRRSPARLTLLTALTAALTAGCGLLPADAQGGGREPVTVMTWAPERTGATDKPGMPAMAEAIARWVNASGGVDGHELKVLTCDDGNNSEGAAACARRAVREDVVAVVGSYSQHGRSFLSPLEAADIPYIGGYGVTGEEFTSPLSYPVNGGQAALLAGNGRQLGEECGRVFLVRPDTVAGDALPGLLDAGLAEAGAGRAVDVPAPESAREYTAQAARVLSAAPPGSARPDCVTAVLGDRTDTFFDTFRRARAAEGREVRIASVLGGVDQSLVDRTGGARGPYEGAYVTGWYPVASDDRWAPMRRVIRDHAFDDNRIDPADAGVQTTWIAYEVLRRAVAAVDADRVTAREVHRVLDDGLSVETGGLTPELRWRFEDLLAARDHPRLVNAEVTFQTVRSGRLTATGAGPHDLTGTLAATP
ncbi:MULTISPECIES: ABC transporter substrate-binding protein [Streptomyces]|uniref:ABC transporter substrate-binding protein n=1 Tax=Streptomyces odorifer TaxID=53450 RepID=A0A7Y6KJB4_9ACTN|nr:ABC transporter substrate-binding protein [Streptomyces odorifer]NUV32107.1 ABC transporter substrate-binding protein [Streptomyces odorifer]NUV35338.1 ABC transporter substrate-binding protein [Streptomyces sp. KAI-27]NUV50323.1 ABC transporter substrate-binding protein [Streptomyces sp. CAI-78]